MNTNYWTSNQYDYNPFLRNLFDYTKMADDGNSRHQQAYDAFREPYANTTNITTETPRDGYIFGGVILKTGVTITRNEFSEMSYDQWKEVESWVNIMPNLVSEEMIDQRVTWIYDRVPVITSMAA